MKTLFKVVWSNDHSSGEFPISYSNRSEAIEAAREWKAEMVSIDEDPEEASREYDWEVVEIKKPERAEEKETTHVD